MTVGDAKRGSNIVNAVLYSTESISALLFSVVSLALIARHFGPDHLARYSVAQSISTLFVVFATLGLEQFVIRELARNRHDAEYVSSTLFGMLAGWALYVALVIAYYLMFQDLAQDLFLIASVVAATLFLKVIFVRAYLQAQNRPKPIAVASLVSRLSSIAYLLVGAYMDFSFDAMMLYLPLQALVLLLAMSIGQSGFFRLVGVRHFRPRRLAASVREAAPVFLLTVLFFFYSQSDVLIMSSLLEAEKVGVVLGLHTARAAGGLHRLCSCRHVLSGNGQEAAGRPASVRGLRQIDSDAPVRRRHRPCRRCLPDFRPCREPALRATLRR